MQTISQILDHELKRGPRFGFLFMMLLLALALPAFLPQGEVFQLSVQILNTGILLVGLASVSRGKRLLLVGVLVVLPAVSLNWMARLVHPRLMIASNLLAIVFLLYLAILIINYLLVTQKADGNTIYGAICVFMLLGFIWGLGFFVLDVIHPGSLLHQDGMPVYDTVGGLLEGTSSSLYLSFVTLTTLGYGDVVPASSPTRTLAVIEAILGQLFLIVMISRYVGLNVAHSIREAEQRTARAAAAAVKEAAPQPDRNATPGPGGPTVQPGHAKHGPKPKGNRK